VRYILDRQGQRKEGARVGLSSPRGDFGGGRVEVVSLACKRYSIRKHSAPWVSCSEVFFDDNAAEIIVFYVHEPEPVTLVGLKSKATPDSYTQRRGESYSGWFVSSMKPFAAWLNEWGKMP
jgi:hypothetical protein